MLEGLVEYGKALADAGDLNPSNVVLVELARQDKARRFFGEAVRDFHRILVADRLPSDGWKLFKIGFEAGYSRWEIVVLGNLKEYEEWRWKANRGDAAAVVLFNDIEAMEAEFLGGLRNLVLLLGVVKAQVDVIKFFKERYVKMLTDREAERTLFRDAIDAALLTEDEMLDYISSKMTVIPARLLTNEPVRLSNLTAIGETPSSADLDLDDGLDLDFDEMD